MDQRFWLLQKPGDCIKKWYFMQPIIQLNGPFVDKEKTASTGFMIKIYSKSTKVLFSDNQSCSTNEKYSPQKK